MSTERPGQQRDSSVVYLRGPGFKSGPGTRVLLLLVYTVPLSVQLVAEINGKRFCLHHFQFIIHCQPLVDRTEGEAIFKVTLNKTN